MLRVRRHQTLAKLDVVYDVSGVVVRAGEEL